MNVLQFINNVSNAKIKFKKFESMDLFSSNYHFRTNTLNTIHINIGSIRKHWLSLFTYLQNIIRYLDIIVLTEINITEGEAINYQLNHFDQFVRCRNRGNGGGIAVFVRDIFLVERLFFDLEESEHLCLKLKHMKLNFEAILSSVYRPPHKKIDIFLDQLNDFLNNNLVKNMKVIMVGDFNICTMSRSKNSSTYLNTLSGNGLNNYIRDYTREEITDGDLKQSCIDHVNVKAKKSNYVESFLIQSKLKDHYFVGCSIVIKNDTTELSKLKNTKVKKTIILNSKVNEEILAVDWNKISDVQDPILLYNKLKYEFEKIYENSKKEIEINELDNFKPWINDNIKKVIKEKEGLFNKWKRDKKNETLKNSYKKCRNKVTAIVSKQYNKYFKQKFQENSNDINKTWRLIDEVLGKKKCKATYETMRKHFPHIADCNILVNSFNNNFIDDVHFHKVSNAGSRIQYPDNMYVPMYNDRSLLWSKVTSNELEEAVAKVKCTSPGIDGIRMIDLKNNFIHLRSLLLKFFNLLLETGNVPCDLKISVVTPLHKKGPKNDIKNYRPIGNVPALSKLLEKLINKKIQPFFEESSAIPDYQHGFRPSKSTGSLLDNFANFINMNLDGKKYVVIVFIDLVKAFDTLEHHILLEKLENNGIGNKIFELIKNYLSNRYQVTKIGNFVSSRVPIKYGLVQGSILSPGFYNIYAADMQYLKVNSKLYQFADDLAIVSADESLGTAVCNLQSDLILIQKWFYNNEIFMNFSKTKSMIVKSPHKKILETYSNIKCHTRNCLLNHIYESSCNCTELEFSSEEKYLGLLIDSRFKFVSHIDTLSNRLRIVSHRLKHVKYAVPQNVMWILYKSLFESLLRYGLTIYGFSAKTHLKSIVSIQNNLVKTIFRPESNYINKILNLSNLHKFLLTMKYFHIEKFRVKNEVSYNLRNQNFRVPKINSNYGKRLPTYFVPKILNSICTSAFTDTENLESFRYLLLRCLDQISLD